MTEAGSKRRSSELRWFRNWRLHGNVEDGKNEERYQFGKGDGQVLRSSGTRANSSR